MSVVVVILVVVIAIAIIGFAVIALRSVSQSAEQSASERTTPRQSSRPMPPVRDFHVRGETASVYFAVPLGEGAAGDHLTELLGANAVEYVRERVDSGLPLEGVHRIDVYAMRADTPERLTTVDLPDVGELPEEAAILRRAESHDPIAAVQAVAADSSVAAPSGRGDTLEPVAAFLELPSPTEAHLRTVGVDTSSMSLHELAVGLLRVSGYQVDPGRAGFSMSSVGADDVYRFSRDADSGILVVIEHARGEYPELDEKVLSEFAVAVAQANPKRAMLVTDKFGPFAMYERERRDKRLVFVTRERLQAFTDSFGLA